MRENGHIRFKIVANGTPIDSNGDPVAAYEDWSEPIPCLVRTVSDNRKAVYVDGEYRAISLEVLVEMSQPYCTCADSVKIGRNGECLGEFRVIRTESLTTVGRIRIFV